MRRTKAVTIEIEFDNEDKLYSRGDYVTGRIICVLASQMMLKSIFVSLEGIEGVHKQFSTQTTSTFHHILNLNKELLAAPIPAARGRNTFPFEFRLPYLIPCSLNIEKGEISYWLAAHVITEQSIIAKTSTKIEIDSTFIDSGNFHEDYYRPYEDTCKYRYFFDLCMCRCPRTVEAKIVLPNRVFICGEIAKFHLFVNNKLNKSITKITVGTEGVVKYREKRQQTKYVYCRDIFEMEPKNVVVFEGDFKFGKRQFDVEFQVDCENALNLQGSLLFDFDYRIFVNVELDVWREYGVNIIVNAKIGDRIQ